jgi:hypothetical protein
MKQIVAVGEAVSGYGYSPLLSDVHGWDSQHYIEVDWHIPVAPIDLSSYQMPYSTVTRLNVQGILDQISKAEYQPYSGRKRRLEDLKEPRKISIGDITNSLIEQGLRIQDSENIAQTINRVSRLARWYGDNDYDVLEHEIRTFLVIPLLISLGWSEQKIKIEFDHIDIAVFSRPYTKKDASKDPYMIIETKSFKDGLYFAQDQAFKYATKYSDCGLLLLTNGYIYKIYEKTNQGFEESGYLNLLDMREHHYLNEKIHGAIYAILKMSAF